MYVQIICQSVKSPPGKIFTFHSPEACAQTNVPHQKQMWNIMIIPTKPIQHLHRTSVSKMDFHVKTNRGMHNAHSFDYGYHTLPSKSNINISLPYLKLMCMCYFVVQTTCAT